METNSKDLASSSSPGQQSGQATDETDKGTGAKFASGVVRVSSTTEKTETKPSKEVERDEAAASPSSTTSSAPQSPSLEDGTLPRAYFVPGVVGAHDYAAAVSLATDVESPAVIEGVIVHKQKRQAVDTDNEDTGTMQLPSPFIDSVPSAGPENTKKSKPTCDATREDATAPPPVPSPPVLESASPPHGPLPGAYFMPGIRHANFSVSTGADDVESPALVGVTAEPVVMLSAHPVNEELERERLHRLNQQEGELREKEQRIHDLEHQQKLRRQRLRKAVLVALVVAAAISISVSLSVRDVKPPEPSPPQPWELFGQAIDGEAPYDNFGMSVDLSKDGDILAVGAVANDGDTGNPGDNRGHVRVFGYNYNTSEWVQIGKDLDGESVGDQFGKTVAVSYPESGVILAAGAPTLPDNNLPSRVRVFQYDPKLKDWYQLGQNLTGVTPYDDFGYEIAQSANGTILAVTCPGCGNGTAVGQVQVFKYNHTFSTWMRMGQNITGDENYDYFGSSVALDDNGTVLASGAIGVAATGAYAGSVRVFKYNVTADSWNQIGDDLYGDTDYDWFGFSVALSSDGVILAVGAGGANGKAKDGYINVYRYWRGRNEWRQMGQSLIGEAAGDRFGMSVDLSEDGYTLVGGGYENDSGTRNETGHARVFRFDDETNRWNIVGQALEGENDNDGGGRAVAISGSGKRVAVASPWHDTNGNHSGQVRVFHME